MTVEGNPALNRVRWAPSGKEVAVGDSDGQVLIYDVGEVSWNASDPVVSTPQATPPAPVRHQQTVLSGVHLTLLLSAVTVVFVHFEWASFIFATFHSLTVFYQQCTAFVVIPYSKQPI